MSTRASKRARTLSGTREAVSDELGTVQGNTLRPETGSSLTLSANTTNSGTFQTGSVSVTGSITASSGVAASSFTAGSGGNIATNGAGKLISSYIESPTSMVTFNHPVTVNGTIASSSGVSGTTGTFSGAVSGTTGTFSGAVSGTTGTFSSTVNATQYRGPSGTYFSPKGWCCKVTTTGSQTILYGTWTIKTWGIDVWTSGNDPYSAWQSGSNSIKVPVAGLYLVGFRVVWNMPSGGGDVYSRLYINGTAVADFEANTLGDSMSYPSAGSLKIGSESLVKLAANDLISIGVNQFRSGGSGTIDISRNIPNNASYFYAVLINAT